jgi:hypothetical protein
MLCRYRERVNSGVRKKLLKFGVLGFGLLQDRDVGASSTLFMGLLPKFLFMTPALVIVRHRAVTVRRASPPITPVSTLLSALVGFSRALARFAFPARSV